MAKKRTTPTTEEFNAYLALNPKASNQDIADHFGIAKSTAASIKSRIKKGTRREFSDGKPKLFAKCSKSVLTNEEPKPQRTAEDIIKARAEAFKGVVKKDFKTNMMELMAELEKEMHIEYKKQSQQQLRLREKKGYT